METAKRPGSFPVARRPAFPNAAIWFGLRGSDARILSLVGFGHGPHAAGADVVLERGWTRRRALRNAASYLIGRALRSGARHLGWRTVKAFSDARLGERGLVYKAVGFQPCPPSKHGKRFRYALSTGTAPIPTGRSAGASETTLPPAPSAARLYVSRLASAESGGIAGHERTASSWRAPGVASAAPEAKGGP